MIILDTCPELAFQYRVIDGRIEVVDIAQEIVGGTFRIFSQDLPDHPHVGVGTASFHPSVGIRGEGSRKIILHLIEHRPVLDMIRKREHPDKTFFRLMDGHETIRVRLRTSRFQKSIGDRKGSFPSPPRTLLWPFCHACSCWHDQKPCNSFLSGLYPRKSHLFSSWCPKCLLVSSVCNRHQVMSRRFINLPGLYP